MIKIIQYFMAVIRAHVYGYIRTTGIYTFFLLKDHVFHYRVHIGTAAQVFVLIKAAICLAPYIAQVQEMEVLP